MAIQIEGARHGVSLRPHGAAPVVYEAVVDGLTIPHVLVSRHIAAGGDREWAVTVGDTDLWAFVEHEGKLENLLLVLDALVKQVARVPEPAPAPTPEHLEANRRANAEVLSVFLPAAEASRRRREGW